MKKRILIILIVALLAFGLGYVMTLTFSAGV